MDHQRCFIISRPDHDLAINLFSGLCKVLLLFSALVILVLIPVLILGLPPIIPNISTPPARQIQSHDQGADRVQTRRDARVGTPRLRVETRALSPVAVQTLSGGANRREQYSTGTGGGAL